ncbi:MAG: hypothetical protein E8A46_11680 [Bradyrhizobium sp.]|uniref:hypothetical protein n=1 Tax=Bradyrhizobium sp. TaxID=376 RepID=UPI001229D29F|nr:hypothetical protein [Bradyrhizobium sp.]THD53028.1 MAG: hypothetical protein E8A46_11680 [Bradyrhizobium sp.]
MAEIDTMGAAEIAGMTKWATGGCIGDAPRPDQNKRIMLGQKLNAAQAAATAARGAGADLDLKIAEVNERLRIVAEQIDLAIFDKMEAEHGQIIAQYRANCERGSRLGDDQHDIVDTDAPEWLTVSSAWVDALDAEISTAITLTNIPATTVPGLMALTVYVSKLTNRGHDWTIGGDLIDEDAGDTEPRSFEACLIRSCAVALAQINGVTAISARS